MAKTDHRPPCQEQTEVSDETFATRCTTILIDAAAGSVGLSLAPATQIAFTVATTTQIAITSTEITSTEITVAARTLLLAGPSR